MNRLPRRVVPATVVAVLVLAAMVAVAWSCVQILLGQPPILPFATLAERGSDLRWADLLVLIGGGLLAALGAVLLTCAWLPGVPNVLSLADIGDHVQAGATRRTVRHAVVTAATRVDGVAHARAQVTPTRVRTTVSTPLRDTGDLATQVRAAIGEQITTIALRRAPMISVRINRTRST